MSDNPKDTDSDLPDYLQGQFDDVPEDLPGDVAQRLLAEIPVQTHLDLPSDGTPKNGLYLTHTAARLWGTAKTIDVIRRTGATWEGRHPHSPIGIGDISKKGGGVLSGHASHRRGVDFDVRLMRNDGRNAYVTIHDEAYSRELTGELIKLFVDNGLVKVTHIFFNDKHLQHPPVQPWPNHDNHFHVRLALA